MVGQKTYMKMVFILKSKPVATPEEYKHALVNSVLSWQLGELGHNFSSATSPGIWLLFF